MKLFRRKPEYALAMPVHRDKDAEDAYLEYAVQTCDESGKPTTSHLHFMTPAQFDELYVPARGRPKTKAAAKTRNGPTKKPKLEKVKDSVNLSEIK